jgi:hypothetical protein
MPTGSKPPIPAGVMKVIHEGVTFLKNWANIYFYLMSGVSGTPNTADVLSLVTQAHNSYNTRIQTHKNSGSSLMTTKGIYVPSVGTEIVAEYSATHAGTGGGTPLSNNAALVLSWLSDQYYRGGHPRSYLDGMETDYVTNPTTWDPTAISTFETAGAGYLSDVNAFTSTHIGAVFLGTVNFARHNAWLSPAVWTPYFGVTVHPRIDSMRRRLGKEVV